MVTEFLSPTDRVKYTLLLGMLETHLKTVPSGHHRSRLDDGCPKCERLVTNLVPLITRGLNTKNIPPTKRAHDLFAGCTDEAELDAAFARAIPGETRAAASILYESKQLLRTFSTIAPHRKEPGRINAYFPLGTQEGLAQIGAYASRKCQLTASPDDKSKWFGVALMCGDN